MEQSESTLLLGLNRLASIQESYRYLDDAEQINDDLRSDETRIFHPTDVHLQAWPKNANDNSVVSITDSASLNEYLRSCLVTKNRLLIFKQEFTFGPILINFNALHLILTTWGVFLPFIDSLRAFGESGSDEYYSGYNQRHFQQSSEILCNIHYPALHGRSAGSPWSIRHMLAYQKYDLTSHVSQWIFISPTSRLQQRVGKIMEAEGVVDVNPTLPLLAMLDSSERGWEGYLKYLKKQYEVIEKMARYSIVGTTDQDCFKICFKDSQKLETIRHKLSTGSAIIASCLNTATGCLKFCETLGNETHQRGAELLLKQADKTAEILSQILNFRNDEETIRNAHTMRDMLRILTDLGLSAKQENESLVVLTEQARKDSRFTKILTFVAMLYMPASLVATIFSSNLIQIISNGDGDGESRLSPVTQFWVFPVSTVVLTILTIGPAMIIERLQTRQVIWRRTRSY